MDFESRPETLSWRDPDGFIVNLQGRILRAVVTQKAEQIRALLGEAWMKRLISEGDVPATQEISQLPQLAAYGNDYVWLEHAAVAFPCFPHEITAFQLYDSASLTLKIAIRALEHGWILKDASAWNVLHSHGRPVFIDLLSFERDARSSTWMAYGQFSRHFLLPLLLYRKLGMIPAEVFLTNRDGIAPERAYPLLGAGRLISWTSLELVLMPKWLTRAGGHLIAERRERKPAAMDADLARDLTLRTLHRLRRMLDRLRPHTSARESVWADYEDVRPHYSEVDLASKKDFVREHLGSSLTVLDLGCNAGEFSQLAAEGGREVVAADADHSAVSRFYERVRGQKARITPLMLNISRPTPAVGWANRETPSFLERAVGKFDCILALGLVHHLLVSDRITLPLLAQLLDELAPKSVIIEWIDPTDSRFAQVAGLNADLYRSLDTGQFEACLGRKFTLAAKLPLQCKTRVMYLWRR